MNTGNGLNFELGKYQKQFDLRLRQLQDQNYVQRLWNKEERLWKKTGPSLERVAGLPDGTVDISLGWLDVIGKMLKAVPMIEDFCKTVQPGFDHVVLLGMGGSSLAPFVFQKTFGNSVKGIKLTVLDSTDPDTIRKVENEINICKTLFIVSSKSGTTAEVMALYDYFFSQVYLVKEAKAGENFIAITDEGSPLSELAVVKNFRKIFINFSDIGGRYSALSYFGIVPAALMGINVKELLERTLSMYNACGPDIPIHKNPGVALGTAIAELASLGCDKLTYLLPPELSTFGLWLEQLLAESTGKNGKGILPINGDPLTEMDIYGHDRVFLQLEFAGKHNTEQSEKLEGLISKGYPVINILIQDELDLCREFFRWEIATATAGAILEVNPFNQPNVQESKKYTDRLLKKIEHYGKLPEMVPALVEDSIHYYLPGKPQRDSAQAPYEQYLKGEGEYNAKLLIEDFFHSVRTRNYIALQAYLPEDPLVKRAISEIQVCIQNSLHLPVTSEFGPRYLHSTGQYHKGGPNTGLFIQFICSSSADIQIPERNYTFGLLKRAQAIGDMEALVKHRRRVILIDLGKDFIKGLNCFKQVIQKAQSALFNEYEVRNGELVNQVVPIHKSQVPVNLN